MVFIIYNAWYIFRTMIAIIYICYNYNTKKSIVICLIH
jgi:hypothetical protein